MIKTVYFIVNKVDLTQNMIDLAIQRNIYEARESSTTNEVILKYDPKRIPIEFYQLSYTPYSHEEMREVLSSPEWTSE